MIEILHYVNDTNSLSLSDVLTAIYQAKDAEVRIVDIDHPCCPHGCVLVAYRAQAGYVVTDIELAEMVADRLNSELLGTPGDGDRDKFRNRMDAAFRHLSGG